MIRRVVPFVLVTLAFVAMGIILSNQIDQLSKTKASVASLEKTNCGLVKFLTTARKARILATKHETGPRKRNDIDAAKGYTVLIQQFKGGCR